MLDVIAAKTPAERHDSIRKLGVVVQTSRANDGRSGVVKTYVVDGKARLKRFVPAASTASSGTPFEVVSEKHLGGPATSESDTTGRWKIGDTGCYWDANDSGPDQCTQNQGRWKVSGQSCYFDANDSGPNQCNPSEPETYASCYDGEPPCASSEDMDDVGIALASMQAELDAAQGDYSSGCSAHPESCDNVEPNVEVMHSGPSVNPIFLESCAKEAGDATVALVGSAGSALALWIGYDGAVASGLSLTAAGAAAMMATAFSIGFVAGYYVGLWIACVMAAPVPADSADEPYVLANRYVIPNLMY
jgi:hypothetical protein